VLFRQIRLSPEIHIPLFLFFEQSFAPIAPFAVKSFFNRKVRKGYARDTQGMQRIFVLDLFRNLASKGINKGLQSLETIENKGYGTGLLLEIP